MKRDKPGLLLVTFVLILSLAACTSKPTPAPEVATKSTPVPTSEKAPTPMPAATQVQEGEARFQLVDYNVFLDPRRDLTIAGIIENTGDGTSHPAPQPLGLVDASGNVVAEVSLDTLELIGPGQKAPFVATIFEHQGIPENWQDLEVRLEEEGYPVDLIFGEYATMEAETLASHSFDAQAEGEPGIYGVSGWITNVAEAPSESPAVFVAGYDAEGKVVDVAHIWDLVSYLGPGTSAPFISTLSMVRPIVSYEVFAGGEVVEPRSIVELEMADYTMSGPDERGRIEFMGEVVNAGSSLAVETEIVLALVTEQGEVVGTGSTPASVISLTPGDRLPFKFSLDLPQELQELWDRPEFLLQGFAEESLSDRYTGVYPDLQVEGLTSMEEKFGRYYLAGQITNTGQSKAEVDVVGALYNGEGKVIDCASPYIGILEPGSSQTLELSFSVETEEEVASFEVSYGGLVVRY